MFFEFSSPFQKSTRCQRRALPAQKFLERNGKALGQRSWSLKACQRQLNLIKSKNERGPLEKRGLRDLALSHDPRIWREALAFAAFSKKELKAEMDGGALSLGNYLRLLERSGQISLDDLPLLLSCLCGNSQDLALLAASLLGTLNPDAVLCQCLLALRDENFDSIPLIHFLGKWGSRAQPAREELSDRLEDWGCSEEERWALEYALGQIPERDVRRTEIASLQQQDAA